MATKPTPTEVKTIIATSLDDASVQVFIDDAALIADQCPAVLSYPDDRQKAIVRWLTAHLIASANRSSGGGQLTSKALGDASESYAVGTAGTELASTSYGRQAIALDPSGCLERVGKTRAFVFSVGGSYGGPKQ